jgi:hydroxymethylpyrimidine pyrophosphatase-like HAD family hydrolase
VFDPSVNKWAGIRHVAARHGIRDEEIVAIGDDVNDLHMVRHAGLGVAMGNARPELLAVADRVIGHNRDEGLAAFLEELVDSHAVEPLDERESDGAAA